MTLWLLPMIRTFDFPYEVPFRHGRRTAFHHVEFDDYGLIDDFDALYYADCLLRFTHHDSLALDSFDFIQKFDPRIFYSASIDGLSILDL